MKKCLILLSLFFAISFTKSHSNILSSCVWGTATVISCLATGNFAYNCVPYLNYYSKSNILNWLNKINTSHKRFAYKKELPTNIILTGLCAIATKYCYDKYKETQ